jgi:ubiquinone/menaquinone biosynthesis C-methylase UbiE
MNEIYIPGHSPRVTRFMAGRHADKYAQFFLPYLRSGMSLLDCGCGPGSMSADLARIIASGIVTGIDFAASQIEFARNSQDYPSNLKFEVASIYSLPFAAGEFDAAFSHALFEHLNKPVEALREIRRVLKPSGVAGICAPDCRYSRQRSAITGTRYKIVTAAMAASAASSVATCCKRVFAT